jgi:hypothetical protein
MEVTIYSDRTSFDLRFHFSIRYRAMNRKVALRVGSGTGNPSFMILATCPRTSPNGMRTFANPIHVTRSHCFPLKVKISDHSPLYRAFKLSPDECIARAKSGPNEPARRLPTAGSGAAWFPTLKS